MRHLNIPPSALSRASQSSKYQKRFFELTADTLAYAKDPQDFKDGNGVQVFDTSELQYVKRTQKVKLEVSSHAVSRHRLRRKSCPSHWGA